MTIKVPVELDNTVQSNSPLTYSVICQVIGEIFLESYLKIKGLQDEMKDVGSQLQLMNSSLIKENDALKKELKALKNEQG